MKKQAVLSRREKNLVRTLMETVYPVCSEQFISPSLQLPGQQDYSPAFRQIEDSFE